jgi:hypothetical protein
MLGSPTFCEKVLFVQHVGTALGTTFGARLREPAGRCLRVHHPINQRTLGFKPGGRLRKQVRCILAGDSNRFKPVAYPLQRAICIKPIDNNSKVEDNRYASSS